MEKENETLKPLLNYFISSLDSRTVIFSVYSQTIILKILQWHLRAWKNWFGSWKKPQDGLGWFELYGTLREAIKKIGKRTIYLKEGSFAMFFQKQTQEHLEANMEENVKSPTKTWYYRDYLYPVFFDLLTELINSSDSGEREFMWSQFPSNWKVTYDNLRSNQIFANLSYGSFVTWAQGRILNPIEGEFDEPLHDIAKNLFPELDSETWEIILIFVLLGYSQVKPTVEKKWTIGYPSERSVLAVSIPWTEKNQDELLKRIMLQKESEMESRINIGIQKAYELANLLFAKMFTKELIAQYIDETEHLKYDERPIETHRQKLLGIFKGLLEYLNAR
jgi:hypothetical protein